MSSILEKLRKWWHCLSTPPESFRNAMRKTLEQIVEQDRIHQCWVDIWRSQRDNTKEKP